MVLSQPVGGQAWHSFLVVTVASEYIASACMQYGRRHCMTYPYKKKYYWTLNLYAKVPYFSPSRSSLLQTLHTIGGSALR